MRKHFSINSTEIKTSICLLYKNFWLRTSVKKSCKPILVYFFCFSEGEGSWYLRALLCSHDRRKSVMNAKMIQNDDELPTLFPPVSLYHAALHKNLPRQPLTNSWSLHPSVSYGCGVVCGSVLNQPYWSMPCSTLLLMFAFVATGRTTLSPRFRGGNWLCKSSSSSSPVANHFHCAIYCLWI